MPDQPTIEIQDQFRVFTMPCCSHVLYWLGSRLPGYCPECGTEMGPKLRTGNHTTTDASATLTYIRTPAAA